MARTFEIPVWHVVLLSTISIVLVAMARTFETARIFEMPVWHVVLLSTISIVLGEHFWDAHLSTSTIIPIAYALDVRFLGHGIHLGSMWLELVPMWLEVGLTAWFLVGFLIWHVHQHVLPPTRACGGGEGGDTRPGRTSGDVRSGPRSESALSPPPSLHLWVFVSDWFY
jgi:hypothetical protein